MEVEPDTPKIKKVRVKKEKVIDLSQEDKPEKSSVGKKPKKRDTESRHKDLLIQMHFLLDELINLEELSKV